MAKLLGETDFGGNKRITDREIYNSEIFNTWRTFRNPICLFFFNKGSGGTSYFLMVLSSRPSPGNMPWRQLTPKLYYMLSFACM